MFIVEPLSSIFVIMKFGFSIILIFFLMSSLCAQKGDPKLAYQYFSQHDFESALDEYLLLLETDSFNEKYLYNVGVCYLNTNIDKTRAISYFETIIRNNKTYDVNLHYLLGMAYHFKMNFDQSLIHFNLYKSKGLGTIATSSELEKQMEYVYNAIELVKYPVNVQFENLGSQVNSIDRDYFPFFPIDESILYFNSNRTLITKENNKSSSRIFKSDVRNGKYMEAQLMPRFTSFVDGTEEMAGLSAEGETALFYLNESKHEGDLYISTKTDQGFTQASKLDHVINSKDGHEIAASINREENVIYFASDREGGFGGTDLYKSQKLPTGEWGPALNLGSSINTPWDEDFPNISPDGKALYFSSKGHTSMGGYDLFMARYNTESQQFEKVRNMGYPLSTVYDDMNFRVSKTGRYGYISALRPEGLGDYDIYRVTFHEIETEYTVIKGYLKAPNQEPIEEVIIDVTDKNTGELYGTYQPNFNTMRYIIILPPGQYELYVEVPGFKKITEVLTVYDKSSFSPEILKDILLER